MKKVYLLFICLVFISSCNDDLVMERNDILSTNNIEISIHDSLLMNKDLVLKKDFAKALSKVFNESLMARNLIKNEALKMIDNDYDVLYQLVKDEMLEDNITFEQYIGKYIEMDKLLSINEKFPTLTICSLLLFGILIKKYQLLLLELVSVTMFLYMIRMGKKKL